MEKSYKRDGKHRRERNILTAEMYMCAFCVCVYVRRTTLPRWLLNAKSGRWRTQSERPDQTLHSKHRKGIRLGYGLAPGWRVDTVTAAGSWDGRLVFRPIGT